MKALWWTLLVMVMSRNAEPGAVNITTSSEDQSIFAGGTQRDPRFLFPFTFISVAADECTTLSTTVTTGVCQAASSCPQLGGTASGTCAGGFGVCCLFTQTCGETTTRNGSSFINPSSPSSDTTVSNCVTTVQLLDNNICQLRLDFVSFELEPPNVNGVCETDFMTITGSANDATIPKLCGSNTGKHMYVDVDPNGGNPTINIDTGITSSQRNWNIKVDQIACNSPYKAPEGCTQYYTNSSGIVESFNYVQPTAAQIADASASLHLNNLRYGICVASRSGYCSISWTKGDTVTTNPYTFGISGDAQGLSPTLIGTETTSLTGTANCSADYVLIPSGEYVDTAGVSVMADRFCGLGFPEQVVVSDIQPFVMYVVTDSNETGDAANFGFRLQYRQNACT